MPLPCNIDSRGRAARFIYGIILAALGVALAIFWAHRSDSALRWIIAAGCLAGGAFAIFEARAGWCVVRAMGFKTRM